MDEALNSDDDAEKMGLRGGAAETPLPSDITHTIKDTSIHEPDSNFPPLGQESAYISALGSVQANSNASFDQRKWRLFWNDWTEDVTSGVTNTVLAGRLRAAEAIRELKRLNLSQTQLSACLSGLRASDYLTFWAVYASIDQVVKGRRKDNGNTVASEQRTTISAGLPHSRYDVVNGDLKGSEGERPSIPATSHMIRGIPIAVADSAFPPSGEEFFNLVALQTAKLYGRYGVLSRPSDREWKEDRKSVV